MKTTVQRGKQTLNNTDCYLITVVISPTKDQGTMRDYFIEIDQESRVREESFSWDDMEHLRMSKSEMWGDPCKNISG